MPGGGSSGGDQGSSGSTAGGSAGTSGGGDVGQIPPPPSEQGAGGVGGEAGGDNGTGQPGDGGEEDPFGDAEAEGSGDCGDSGVMPGGIGGMGQAGECLGGGGGGAGAESEAAAAGSDGGGSNGGAGDGEGPEGVAQGTGGAGSVGQFPGESDEERAERLGRELDESIGGFDETLQEEQREIAAVGRSTEGFDTGGAGGSQDGGGRIGLGTQAGNMANIPNEGGSAGGSSVPDISSMTQEESEGRTPDDVPLTIDDDIIARQLREAALTEDDPVLRERLWAEYRKYKGL